MADLGVNELSDEELNQLIALGVIPEQQAELVRQAQQASALRRTPMPGMRQAGNVAVAANPLEFLGAGLQQYAGQRREKELEGKLDDLRKQQLQARQLFANRMMDTQYRRASQPFMQGVGNPEDNVPMPNMGY